MPKAKYKPGEIVPLLWEAEVDIGRAGQVVTDSGSFAVPQHRCGAENSF